MKLSFLVKRPGFLPLAGAISLSGLLVAAAVADDRVGTDAPHEERSSAATAAKFQLPAAVVPVAVAVSSPAPIKAKSRKRRNKAVAAKNKELPKTAAVTSSEKPKAAATTSDEQRQSSGPDDYNIGNDAPHQERGSDPDARAGRLIIIGR